MSDAHADDTGSRPKAELAFDDTTLWFHWTPDPLEVGTVLVDAETLGDGYWNFGGDQAWRHQRVWLFADPIDAVDFGGLPGHVYACHAADCRAHEPTETDLDPDCGLDAGMADQYHAARAVIVAEVALTALQSGLARRRAAGPHA